LLSHESIEHFWGQRSVEVDSEPIMKLLNEVLQYIVNIHALALSYMAQIISYLFVSKVQPNPHFADF